MTTIQFIWSLLWTIIIYGVIICSATAAICTLIIFILHRIDAAYEKKKGNR